MATFKILPKNNLDVDQKPRVYFTCHPEDLDTYFQRICADLFKTQDCAVYYTPDMTEVILPEEQEVDLGRNNLFVVPVTFKLLSTPNRAMDADIPYALQNHIPVLPVLMEPGLDALYARQDKFGQLQYLNPCSTDITEIAYEEKLKKYLSSVLISSEMAKRVRAAFDAYIFLSYRKKDRHHANALMRLIHQSPRCRDIAVWFDEFLTPGESFRDNIDRILSDSKLFALLVTPNLLEEPGGKPNFVMAEEYPAARNAGIRIFPVEMEKTDKKALKEKYAGLPACVDPRKESHFREHLLDTIQKLALQTNDAPEHTFLMGLAYMDGIDVEVDRQRGLALLTQAAQAGLPEAMDELADMYYNGIRVPVDFRQAACWAQKLADVLEEELGEENEATLSALNRLAAAWAGMGEYEKGLQISQRIYALACRLHGEDHPETLTELLNMAYYGSKLYRDEAMLALLQKAYDRCREILGLQHPKTLAAMTNLALGYDSLGMHTQALELHQSICDAACRLLGENHLHSLTAVNNLAASYSYLGEHEKAARLLEENYAAKCAALGKEHPETLTTLHNLGLCYNKCGETEKAAAVQQEVYALRCRLLGEKHPLTLVTLNTLAGTFLKLGEVDKGLETVEKVYYARFEILGQQHPDTVNSRQDIHALCDRLKDRQKRFAIKQRLYGFHRVRLGQTDPYVIEELTELALTSFRLGELEKAAAYFETEYTLRCKVFGEDRPETLRALNNLAVTYGEMEDVEKELALHRKTAQLRKKYLGESHPDTLTSMGDLAFAWGKVGNYRKKLALEKQVYALRCKVLGQTHPDTLRTLNNLAFTYGELGDSEKALELGEKVYTLYCQTCSEEHPDTLGALNNLAVQCGRLGDFAKEAQLQERVYALRCKVLGESHPDTMLSLYNLSVAYYNMGDMERSLELEYLYSCTERGETDVQTLNLLSKWSAVCGHYGNYKKQLELAEKLYALCCRVFGPAHSQTQKIASYAEGVRRKLQEQP